MIKNLLNKLFYLGIKLIITKHLKKFREIHNFKKIKTNLEIL